MNENTFHEEAVAHGRVVVLYCRKVSNSGDLSDFDHIHFIIISQKFRTFEAFLWVGKVPFT
jgi:hypothetical protein